MSIAANSNTQSRPAIIIAVDGPSASGKGTIARKLAAKFGFAHLDTGLLYRAVAMVVILSGDDPTDPLKAENAARAFTYEGLSKIKDDPFLRGERVSQGASKVAAIPAVRAALLKFQQDFCQNPPMGKAGAVLDGRDIGTVIAPHAPVKLYITASTEARAERRFKELQGRGENVTYATVLKDMQERDVRDTSRSAAPAKPAADAIVIDTTNMTADAAFGEAVKIAERLLSVK